MTRTHTIDATGKTFGRIATDVATRLLAKDSPDFKRNAVADVTVRVINVSAVAIDPKKLKQKTYHTHSGYPGGDRRPDMAQVIAKKGHGEILRRAVKSMLPLNTLRDKRLKNLVTED
jgi:large subunit ribosomal protein L13